MTYAHRVNANTRAQTLAHDQRLIQGIDKRAPKSCAIAWTGEVKQGHNKTKKGISLIVQGYTQNIPLFSTERRI